MTETVNKTSWKGKLRKALMSHFTERDLKDIAFDLNLDIETVAGSEAPKSEIVIGIINYFEQRGRLEELIICCKEQRPNVDWDGIAAEARTAPPQVLSPQVPKQKPLGARIKLPTRLILPISALLIAIFFIGKMLSNIYLDPADTVTESTPPIRTGTVVFEDEFDLLSPLWSLRENWRIVDGRVMPNEPTSGPFFCPALRLEGQDWNISSIRIEFFLRGGERNAEILFGEDARVELHPSTGKIFISQSNGSNRLETSPQLTSVTTGDEKQTLHLTFDDEPALTLYLNGTLVFGDSVPLPFSPAGSIGFLGCAGMFEVDKISVFSQ